MKFEDRATIVGTRRRDDGYLVASVRAARTGIQEYAGFEVGVADKDVVRIYRPEPEVFAKDAMASFAHRPVTVEHPAELVTADNWKQHAVGQTSDEVARDGDYLRIPLMVSDAAAIDAIEGGKRELSAGYTCDVDMTAGTTPDGRAYDGIQKNIRANHVAIVQRGRAGHECRIGDGAAPWGAAPLTNDRKDADDMSDKLVKITIDGLPFEVTDQAAAAIKKLEDANAALSKKATDTADEHKAALDAKDKELATKDAEIADLKGKVLTADALDKAVADRAELVAKARKVAKDADFTGLSDAAIRRAAVIAVRGEDAVKGKSDAYVDAAFDLLVEDAVDSADPVRDALKGRKPVADDREAAYGDYLTNLSDAWKGEAKKEAV